MSPIGHRTVKRVPLGFDWPLGKVWTGYLKAGSITEQPRGRGWQLWETVSEGSPMSPVFESAQALAEWCAENATIYADQRLPEERWLQLITDRESLETASLGIADQGYIGSLEKKP